MSADTLPPTQLAFFAPIHTQPPPGWPGIQQIDINQTMGQVVLYLSPTGQTKVQNVGKEQTERALGSIIKTHLGLANDDHSAMTGTLINSYGITFMLSGSASTVLKNLQALQSLDNALRIAFDALVPQVNQQPHPVP